MAAIPVSAPIDLEVAVRPRAGALTGPRSVPAAPVALPRRRTKPVRVANVVATVLVNAVVFMVVAATTYAASGFVGNVELDAANREALRAMDRATSASAAESGLRVSVDRLGSDEAIQRWATFHGFVPPYKLDTTEKPAKVK